MENPQIILEKESPSSKESDLEQEDEGSEAADEDDAAAEQNVELESQPEPRVDNVSSRHCRIIKNVTYNPNRVTW